MGLTNAELATPLIPPWAPLPPSLMCGPLTQPISTESLGAGGSAQIAEAHAARLGVAFALRYWRWWPSECPLPRNPGRAAAGARRFSSLQSGISCLAVTTLWQTAPPG
eukprot:8682435-Prorocentrum_lima.AAC.1